MSKREQYIWLTVVGLIVFVGGWYAYHDRRFPRTVEDVLGVLVTMVLVGVVWIIRLLLTR